MRRDRRQSLPRSRSASGGVPDPLVRVTEQLHAWFEAEPWSTSRQLLERLQAAHPDEYPDGLLRTVQRVE